MPASATGACGTACGTTLPPAPGRPLRRARLGESGPATASFSPHADVVAFLDQLGSIGLRSAVCPTAVGSCVETALEYPERVGRSRARLLCGRLGYRSGRPRNEIEEADEVGEEGDVERAVELELRIWLDGYGRPEPLDPVVREAGGTMNSDVDARTREQGALSLVAAPGAITAPRREQQTCRS